MILEGIQNGQPYQATRLISCIRGVTNPYEDYSSFLKLAENPYLKFVVSNTTEAGIVFEEEAFVPDRSPKTFPGKLTAFLYHRYRYFNNQPPKDLVMLPCELIDKNGDILKGCVLKYTEHWSLSTGFQNWVENKLFFCNTLVDRIVPGFPKENIKEIQGCLGYTDNLVVKAEPFHLWVVEGPEHLEQKLNFKKAGLNVIFTDNLNPYRTRKVRILNGAHTAMVPIAYLNGFREVREVVEDKKMKAFLDQIIFKEIIPTLDMPREELESYAMEVLDRFRNPFVKHQLSDIALNSISKFRVRVLPSLLNYLEKYREIPEGLASAFAYLIIFYKGEDGREPIPLRDEEVCLSFFKDTWRLNNVDLVVDSILSNKIFWGVDLSKKIVLSNFLKEKIKSLSDNE